MGNNPSHFMRKGEDAASFPVEAVSHRQAVSFCERASLYTGGEFRLLTEAEWEYACRAGTRTRFYNGDADDKIGEIAHYKGNNLRQTEKVGNKAPNAFGLYDMTGNVWEWGSDYWTPGIAAAGVSAQCLVAQEKPVLEIIDTHTHFFDPTRPQGVPWPGRNNKRLYRPVLPDEFKRLSHPLGVVGTVVVEASAWVEDNQWLLELAEKEPFLVGVVGRIDPASDDFPKHLRRFPSNPLYRGIRISWGELPEGLKEGGKLVGHGKLLIDHNLELDVNGGPDMPAHVARLADRLPKLRIVINHAANLRIDGREPPEKWREGMQAAAKHPNVFCKVSALVEQTSKKPAPREVDYYRGVNGAKCAGSASWW